MRIAQPFKAGWASFVIAPVPKGRLNCILAPRINERSVGAMSAVPSGLAALVRLVPSLERLGYYHCIPSGYSFEILVALPVLGRSNDQNTLVAAEVRACCPTPTFRFQVLLCLKLGIFRKTQVLSSEASEFCGHSLHAASNRTLARSKSCPLIFPTKLSSTCTLTAAFLHGLTERRSNNRRFCTAAIIQP